MGIVKSGVLGFLAVFVALCVVLLIVLLSLNSLLYPEIYIEGLKESGALSEMEGQLQQIPVAGFIKMPDGSFEALISAMLSNLFSYLRSESDDLNMTIEIDEAKLKELVLQQLGRIRTCNPGELPNPQDPSSICMPGDQDADEIVRKFLAEQNLTILENNKLDLSKIYGLGVGSPARKSLDELRKYVAVYKMAIFLFAFFIIILLSVMFFLEYHNTPGFMRWAGFPVLIAGVIVMFFAMLGINAINENIAGSESSIMSEILKIAIKNITSELYFYSAVAIAFGLIVFLISFVARREDSEIHTVHKKKK